MTDAQEMRFSEALAELEEIVKELESGRLDLEEAIARYEQGVKLLGDCRATLDDAQLRITALMGELESDESGGDA